MEHTALLTDLADLPEFEGGPGAQPSDLVRLRVVAGGALTEEYEAFLLLFGFAIWDGGMLYGTYELGSVMPPSYDADAERQTLKQRSRLMPSCFGDVSANGLVIMKYEGGGFYFLHSAASGTPGVVARYEFAEPDGPTESWPTFEQFLRRAIRLSER